MKFKILNKNIAYNLIKATFFMFSAEIQIYLLLIKFLLLFKLFYFLKANEEIF